MQLEKYISNNFSIIFLYINHYRWAGDELIVEKDWFNSILSYGLAYNFLHK